VRPAPARPPALPGPPCNPAATSTQDTAQELIAAWRAPHTCACPALPRAPAPSLPRGLLTGRRTAGTAPQSARTA